MFCFKETVSQDFLLQVFSWIIFPQAYENPQIFGLKKFVTFADLSHVGQFVDLRTQYFLQFADLRFADPILLLTYNFSKSEILYFSAYKYIPKMF
jgi:hypothetical protein